MTREQLAEAVAKAKGICKAIFGDHETPARHAIDALEEIAEEAASRIETLEGCPGADE